MFLIAGSIFLFLSLIAGACIIHLGLLIVTVEHQSMHPTLQHGDRVLALRRGFRRWIRRGSIVLIALPDDAELPETPGLSISSASWLSVKRRLRCLSGTMTRLLPRILLFNSASWKKKPGIFPGTTFSSAETIVPAVLIRARGALSP